MRGLRGIVTHLMAARVAGDPLTSGDHLNGMTRCPYIDLLANERMRDTVVAAIKLNVIVNVNRRLMPLGQFLAPGIQWLEIRRVQGLECRPAIAR
jgi:hypothetical protein